MLNGKSKKMNDDKVKYIKESCKINNQVFKLIHKYIKTGVTEKELAEKMEELYNLKGCKELAFPIIVAFGKNSANIHHEPTNKKLKKNDIIMIDAGCKYKGYCSDKTRTFVYGKADKTFRTRSKLIKKAYKEAKKMAEPSLDTRKLHLKAVEILGDYEMPHALGHGVGKDVHEKPIISSKEEHNVKLEKGMIFTIEPGIYIKNWGGIRYEDTFLLTKRGCKRL
jgi:Xaa-Pro aminopeptidase